MTLQTALTDESLLADILTKKFADHLPIYRQAEMLAREGIYITRQTLSQWVVRAGVALEPIYDELIRQIIKSDNVFIDETPIDMLAPGKGKVHKAFMWVMCGGKEKDPPYRVYDFYTNRKHANAEKLLDGYDGVVHSDKYGAYEALANAKYREALGYFCGLIPHLKNYTLHAYARLDNNVAERAVRPLAIGRKNWLFVGNEDGGKAAAILFSLVQTCRAVGVNPREYLTDVMHRLMSHNSQKLDELLPDRWLASRALEFGHFMPKAFGVRGFAPLLIRPQTISSKPLAHPFTLTLRKYFFDCNGQIKSGAEPRTPKAFGP